VVEDGVQGVAVEQHAVRIERGAAQSRRLISRVAVSTRQTAASGDYVDVP
jgi:hypothetical protein